MILSSTKVSYVVFFSCWVMSNSLRPHVLQHTRLPCPLLSPRGCSDTCPLSRWCHPTISSFVIPFSSCLQSFLASGSLPMSRLFASGGQRIGASTSASVAPDLPCQNSVWEVGICILSKFTRLNAAGGPETGIWMRGSRLWMEDHTCAFS